MARDLFAEQGYAATRIEDVVLRVGVTRGMLFPQFHSKSGLFAVVYQEQCVALAHAIAERIRAAGGATRQQVVLTVCHAFID